MTSVLDGNEATKPEVKPGSVFVVRQVIEFQHHGVFIRDVVSFTEKEGAEDFIKDINAKTTLFLSSISQAQDGNLLGPNAQIVGSLFAMSRVLYQMVEMEVRVGTRIQVVRSPIVLTGRN